MAIVVGSLLIFGVAVLTLPYLIKYCNQTSETPVVVPEKEKDEETEETEERNNDLKDNEKSELKDQSKRGEEFEIQEETEIINSEPTLCVKNVSTGNLVIEKKKIMKDASVNTMEIRCKDVEEDIDKIREDKEKKMHDVSTQSSATIYSNHSSPDRSPQTRIVHAVVHTRSPITHISESQDDNNFPNSMNTVKPGVSQKQKRFSKKGKGFKKFFKSIKSRSFSSLDESARNSQWASEESGNHVSHVSPAVTCLEETLSSPSGIENQRPMGNSTFSEKYTWHLPESNGTFKIIILEQTHATSTSYVSIDDYHSATNSDRSNIANSFNFVFMSPNASDRAGEQAIENFELTS